MNLRSEMPTVAAWVDSLREAFGKAEIDARIRQGMNGDPGAFYAQENGIEVGSRARPAQCEISGADMVVESKKSFQPRGIRRNF